MAERRFKSPLDNRFAKALTYVPEILRQLDGNGREMFATVLQAATEAGYNDGFADGHSTNEFADPDRKDA